MSLLDTRRTNFVLYALQRMYEVAGEIADEKEALKDDLAV